MRAPDTIFALSSGALPAGIAVVRISGPGAADTAERLAGSLPEPRTARVRALHDAMGGLLDRALVLWLPGPATATGEDVAELHLHGGRAVVAAVLAALADCPGCRPAEPGEFTRRAFLNGRIDLIEAEGLADLLAAETEVARRQALRMAEGGLSARVEALRVQLLGLAARAEAMLEFGDDEADVGPDPALISDIAALREQLCTTLALPPAERLRDGFRVVIAGPPNAGKSSLINAMAGRHAAIVSAEAGTTRDLIEVPVTLDGMALILIDSAGLRQTDAAVESIGIELAEQAIAAADLLLWLGDPTNCPRDDAIRVHARADLLGREKLPPEGDVMVSVESRFGLDSLQHMIIERLGILLPPADITLMTERQRRLIANCATHLEAVDQTSLPELMTEDLRLALRELDRVVGRSDAEGMLDALFGRFCIGK